MDKTRLNYFRDKLLKEKNKVNQIINQIESNGTVNSNVEMSSELSHYDNHGADAAGNLVDIQRDRALKGNEVSILNKIDNALKNIENGEYGKCKICKKPIPQGRLEFIPYAEHCVDCQNSVNDAVPDDINNRPSEESVLGLPFRYGFNDNTSLVGFDAEDSYQAVARFNAMDNVYDQDYDDDNYYVDHMDLISNEQYKNQLPD